MCLPIWILNKLQCHMTIAEALRVQKSGLVAKIGISKVKQIKKLLTE